MFGLSSYTPRHRSGLLKGSAIRDGDFSADHVHLQSRVLASGLFLAVGLFGLASAYRMKR
jgi:hypothetical protein